MVSPVDVVLHIGTTKTGTTTLQQLFRQNRETLKERGVLYPRSTGRVRHIELGHYAKGEHKLGRSRTWVRSQRSDADAFRRKLQRRLARELARSQAHQMVLSDEILFRLPPYSMRRIKGLVRPLASNLRLVVYLRRQDDHLVSRYQQQIKTGRTETLSTWATGNFRNQYDYAERLRLWKTALEPDQVVPRRFDRAAFANGSLEQEFLLAAGIDVSLDDLEPVPIRNESLGASAVEVLRILNLHRHENLGQRPWQFDNRPYVNRLREASFGEQRLLTLPDDELDRFQEQWEESNRQVAREYFGLESGELFITPRRTKDRTTVQRLDPAEFELYLDLLEIPQADRPPLRAIAEREAARHDGRTD